MLRHERVKRTARKSLLSHHRLPLSHPHLVQIAAPLIDDYFDAGVVTYFC